MNNKKITKINSEKDILNNNYDIFKDEKNHFNNFIPNSVITRFYFEKILIIEKIILLFSILSIFITEFEYTYEVFNLKHDVNIKIQKFLSIFSLIITFLLILKYKFTLKYYKISYLIDNKKCFLKLNDNIYFLFEFIIYFSHNSHFLYNKFFYYHNIITDLRIKYRYNSLFHFISLFKILLIFRNFMINTYWGNDKSYRITIMYGCNNNLLFILKCMIKEEAIKLVTFILFIGILFFGGCLRLIEGSIPDQINYLNYKNIFNCYWNSLITMTTVGYGDMYPKTYFGRIIIFFCSFFGITIISLMVVSVSNSLNLDKLESKSLFILKKLIYRDKMEKHASALVGIAFQIKFLKRKNIINSKLNLKLNFHKNYFNYFRIEYKNLIDDNYIDELDRLKSNLKCNLDELKDEIINSN